MLLTKDELKAMALETFLCDELAEMSREKFTIQVKKIHEKHEPMTATLEIAKLQCSMWSPEYRKSIDEYLTESKNRYRVNYDEM